MKTEEEKRATRRAWEAKNVESLRATRHAWYWRNVETCRAKSREAQRKSRERYRSDKGSRKARQAEGRLETTRVCSKCGIEKPSSEFHYARCLMCRREQKRTWLITNPEKQRACNATWREKNKEKIRKQNHARYARNKPKHREQAYAWRQANRERDLEYHRAWGKGRRSSKEYRKKQREWGRAWYLANKERQLAKSRAWRIAHKDQFHVYRNRNRAKRREAKGQATPEQIAARVAFYGSRCAYCNGPYESIDHVVPLSRGGSNWPANLRPACKKCNFTKGTKRLLKWKAA